MRTDDMVGRYCLTCFTSNAQQVMLLTFLKGFVISFKDYAVETDTINMGNSAL